MQTASGPISPAPSQLSSETVEHRLAVKDVGKEVEENSPRVRQFAAVLDSLEAKCQEDREQIGQTIITVHDTLSKRGVVKEADLLDIANSLDNSIPEKSETKGKIADIGAAYIVRYSPKK
ncbi:MAG TPA: hypothetical protein VKU00_17740 [Chthonomonadaceae bacterium]|nr:hypothetical protein [Chthonomonadaceae bacterium]